MTKISCLNLSRQKAKGPFRVLLVSCLALLKAHPEFQIADFGFLTYSTVSVINPKQDKPKPFPFRLAWCLPTIALLCNGLGSSSMVWRGFQDFTQKGIMPQITKNQSTYQDKEGSYFPSQGHHSVVQVIDADLELVRPERVQVFSSVRNIRSDPSL